MARELFDTRPDPSSRAHRGAAGTAADTPLAERMRPTKLEEVVGQEHVLGPGKMLALLLEGQLKQSLLLWGPPGVGKTTLARLIAQRSELRFTPFSAVLSGIKEVREVMAEASAERARSGLRTLLFVDEIHRFNKAQQDAFLPFMESGDIVLIGATTENPSFELNSALLSRSRVVILQPLSTEALVQLLERALAEERGLAGRVRADRTALERIANAADGDARRALNLLETAAAIARPGAELDDALLAQALQRKQLAYDRSGEEHYNLISALHKSIRNSDDSASLYWLTRMLESGEDRDFLARRLIRIAIEDVGLADPFALRIALDGADAWHRLGSPEGELALVQVAVYLARARKSNAVYVAHKAAIDDVQRTAAEPVPLHLRNAPTALMKAAGYGSGYRYAHDDPKAKDEMTCLPPSLLGRRYFPERPRPAKE
jgi:putative ATPase